MIRYAEGNLLEAPAEALVNTVNEVGVMGKGIALMFREMFPEPARAYERAAKEGAIRVGQMFVTENRNLLEGGPRWIIHFPTKKHWRNPSKLEWIRDGLRDLKRVIGERQIRSVALPPLGCGSGGLDWELVKREITAAAEELPTVEFIVFPPSGAYQNVAKREGVEELTPARALIAELVRRYAILGLDCSNLEVQKLAYFLDRSLRTLKLPDPLKLNFSANKYGPYADRLRHLLNGLDGSYLHCEKRLSDAGPADLIWFEDAKKAKLIAYLQTPAVAEYLTALEKTAATIDGFESPLGLELLATVDWLLTEVDAQSSVRGIRDGLSTWPGGVTAGRRKKKLFDDRLIALALKRLGEVGLLSSKVTPTAQ
jgi:O-acetyl-ADP-ribose deacetylase (regulator of RNase III)